MAIQNLDPTKEFYETSNTFVWQYVLDESQALCIPYHFGILVAENMPWSCEKFF